MANNFLLATNDTFGEKSIRSAVVYTEERFSVYTTAYCRRDNVKSRLLHIKKGEIFRYKQQPDTGECQ